MSSWLWVWIHLSFALLTRSRSRRDRSNEELGAKVQASFLARAADLARSVGRGRVMRTAPDRALDAAAGAAGTAAAAPAA
jgi:hypothetical protein